MSGLELSDTEEHKFQQAVTGYGVEVVGGTAEKREKALRENAPGDYVVVDGRHIPNSDEFEAEVVMKASGMSREEIERQVVVNIGRHLEEHGMGLIVMEFDSMDTETRRHVSQSLKGVAERMGYEGAIGYTCSEAGAVIRANGDLSMRIQTFELSD